MSGRWHSTAWLGLWIAALVALSVVVATTLRVSSDLRLFLPDASTPAQQFVLDGIGDSPASRLLLVALDGGDPAVLAELSHALAERLRGSPEFRQVRNGAEQRIPDWVTEHRYLLTPARDGRPFDEGILRDALTERLQDLASPAAPLLESLIPADPTLEALAVLESWAARAAPRSIGGAWFDESGTRALLAIETAAGGFDPDAQARAIAALESAFESLRDDDDFQMTVSGPGRFSALMKERTQREATVLGSAATVALLVLLYFAYRRWRVLLLAALPIASAGLAGLAMVGIRFGEVHGITLAFGFTLIGVAQDYPLHLFSHQHRTVEPLATARALWRTLATGVASTCVAYLAFLASGVAGLAQLAWFTITGLLVAGLTTRYALPRIMGDDFRDAAELPPVARLDAALAWPALRAPGLGGAALAAIAILLLAPGRFWQDDLGALTPVPRELLAVDNELRHAVGAPDARYLGLITAATPEAALAALEAATPGLEAQVAAGAISQFDHAARYLPSAQRQRERQRALPAPDALAAMLAAAARGLPYRDDTFTPFLADLERARTLSPLTLDGLRSTTEAALVDGLLREREDGWAATLLFSGVIDAAALGSWAGANGVTVIDLKGESAALVVRQRERMLLCLAAAALLLVAVVRLSLGSWGRAARVLAPMALSTLLIVMTLRLAGQALDLFHLVSLVLAAGLGLDYALFFEHAGLRRPERLRTLHGVLACALSTLMVFVLLSFSTIPVLRSIGITVALGVTFNFLLALSIPRSAARA